MIFHFCALRPGCRPVLFFLFPVSAFVGVMLIHAALGDAGLGNIFNYLSHNSSIDQNRGIMEMFIPYMPKLFPNDKSKLFCLFFLVLCFVYCVTMYRSKPNHTRFANASVMSIPIATIVSLFVLQLPFLDTGYYPRTIIFSYHVLAVVMLVMSSHMLFIRNGTQDETLANDVKVGEVFKFAGDVFRKTSRMKAHSFKHDREMTMNKHMLCDIVQL